MGDMELALAEPRVRNSRAKRRTSAHIQAALRIMRGPSPTRHNVVVLLRRDVFALKICAHNACAALRAFLKGVYEVNHLGAYTYMYIHIPTCKDMRCD